MGFSPYFLVENYIENVEILKKITRKKITTSDKLEKKHMNPKTRIGFFCFFF